MHIEEPSRSLISLTRLPVTNAVLAIALGFALTTISVQSAQAQTFTVLHNLNGLQDGYYPTSGVTLARNGDLYGTTQYSGLSGGDCYLGCGTAYRVARKGSGWIFTLLYSFAGGNDGGNSTARVIFGPDGSLYGTTSGGGGGSCEGGCGTVFNLRPPHASPNVLGNWTETVLYRFTGGDDGAPPEGADLIFDRAGNLYGTTFGGGTGNCQGGCGTVYKLTPSNGTWTESVLHNFTTEGGDGQRPWGGVIFDQSGNLYGTTTNGPFGTFGTIYKLIPAGLTWTEQILYTFQGTSDGEYPYSGLVFDQMGNLYGSTCCGGPGGIGRSSNSRLLETGRYPCCTATFGGYGGLYGSLAMDAAGNLYGTTSNGGAYNFGSVFKLTPGNGGWTYTSLHDFCSGGWPCSDGALPNGGVASIPREVLRHDGRRRNVDSGVIWEITP